MSYDKGVVMMQSIALSFLEHSRAEKNGECVWKETKRITSAVPYFCHSAFIVGLHLAAEIHVPNDRSKHK